MWYLGNEIAQAVKGNKQLCADFSARTTGGRFWAFNTQDYKCYVLTSISQRYAYPNAVSGNRECASAGKRSCGPYISKNTFFMVEE